MVSFCQAGHQQRYLPFYRVATFANACSGARFCETGSHLYIQSVQTSSDNALPVVSLLKAPCPLQTGVAGTMACNNSMLGSAQHACGNHKAACCPAPGVQLSQRGEGPSQPPISAAHDNAHERSASNTGRTGNHDAPEQQRASRPKMTRKEERGDSRWIMTCIMKQGRVFRTALYTVECIARGWTRHKRSAPFTFTSHSSSPQSRPGPPCRGHPASDPPECAARQR
jgi:hypothetical protein